MKTLTEILRSLEGLSDIELFVIDLFLWEIRFWKDESIKLI